MRAARRACARARAERQIGLEPAAATFRAFDAKGALLGEVSIGDPDATTGLPALSSQDPTVWRIANDFGRQAPLSPEAWKNLFLKGPQPQAEPAAPKDEPAAPPSP